MNEVRNTLGIAAVIVDFWGRGLLLAWGLAALVALYLFVWVALTLWVPIIGVYLGGIWFFGVPIWACIQLGRLSQETLNRLN
jgi:hypothetical protein